MSPQTDSGAIRADKWLWFARFFKSRTLAGKLCTGGKLRINGAPVGKSHAVVRCGDVLTFPQGRDIRVIRVVMLGARRGPAAEAQALYEDLQPPDPRRNETPMTAVPRREPGSGRPTKADRRALDRLRGDL
jgi:ribosome-associated heat shock protein Hsp15